MSWGHVAARYLAGAAIVAAIVVMGANITLLACEWAWRRQQREKQRGE